MADRQIPEDDEEPTAVKAPYTRKIPELRNGAMGRRLKSKLQKTPHEMHVAHVAHEANVKNNPNKYR